MSALGHSLLELTSGHGTFLSVRIDLKGGLPVARSDTIKSSFSDIIQSPGAWQIAIVRYSGSQRIFVITPIVTDKIKQLG
jgi:hypothetical protein